MTVYQLIQALSKVKNGSLEVLVADNEHWYYDVNQVAFEKVTEGKVDDENGTLVVVLR